MDHCSRNMPARSQLFNLPVDSALVLQRAICISRSVGCSNLASYAAMRFTPKPAYFVAQH